MSDENVNDRRRRRSHFKDLALQYWLESVASKSGLTGLALCDDASFLVASSLPRTFAEKLVSTALGESNIFRRQLDVDGVTVSLHELVIHGKVYFLCAVGGVLTDEALGLTTFGVERILAEALPD